MEQIYVVNVAQQAPVFIETSLALSEFLHKLDANVPVQIIKVKKHDNA
ncbi:MAG: hypothetical protein K2J12_07490 [Muribaculaceae bacterium]|nr:hypothetical protein [Muribaculaceae bacterium]